MQEIITYIIIAATVTYVVFRTAKLILKKENDSSCVSGGCSGCSVQTKCVDPIKSN